MSVSLSPHLEKELEITDDGRLVRQTDFKHKSEEFGNIVISKKDIIVHPRFSKEDTDLIIDYHMTVVNRAILELKDKYKIEFVDEYDLVRDPGEDDDRWGYLRWHVKDSNIWGDGEVHNDTLDDIGISYAYSTLFRRAEARGILKRLGVFQKGLYSDIEFKSEIDYDEISGRSATHTPSKNDPKKNSPNKKSNSKTEKRSDFLDDEEENHEEVLEAMEFDYALKKVVLLKKILKKSDDDVETDIMTMFGLSAKEAELTKLRDLDQLEALEDAYIDEFENEDDLWDALVDIVNEFGFDQGWRNSALRDNIRDTLKDKKVTLNKLTIDELFQLIDSWDIWKTVN